MSTHFFLELEGAGDIIFMPTGLWMANVAATAKSITPNGDRGLAPAEEAHPNCGGPSQDAACSPEA